MLLPEEAEELLEPLFLSMSEAVAAALGELCGINWGLGGGGGGGRSRAGAVGTQAHGVRGRRGSAAAAVLGLHGDIFPCFLTRLLKLGREAAGGAVEPAGGSDRDGGGGRGSEVRAGPGGAEAAGNREARVGARAPPAGRTDTLSRRGARERAGCLGVGDGCLRHSDRHSPLGRGREAPRMATSRQTASRRTRMDSIYGRDVEVKHSGKCGFRPSSGSSNFFFPCVRAYGMMGLVVQVLVIAR